MGRRRGPRAVVVLILGGALAGCAARVPVEELPTPRETLAAVAARLGRSRSPQELRRIASRGRRVLRALRPEERDALGRGLIRFRVDRPAFIAVVAPSAAAPFWLEEQGFANTRLVLPHADGPFVVYQKLVPPGWVGLGVNALDRSPRSHYAVFILPREPGAAPTIRGLAPATVRAVRSEPGVSAFVDVHKPFLELDPLLVSEATLLQTSGAERAATVLPLDGTGR